MALSHDLIDQDRYRRALRPGLRLDPMLEQGRDIDETETDEVIRAILTEEPAKTPAPKARRFKGGLKRRALPSLSSQKEMRKRATRRALVRELLREADREEGSRTSDAETARTPRSDAIAARPWRKWVKPGLIGVALAAVILRPGAVLLTLMVGFWMMVIGIISLGRGSMAEGFGVLYRRIKARNPARAERLRVRMDILAERWDRVLDLVPGDWADGLALPDFSRGALDPDAVAAERPDPFDRLAGGEHA